MLGPTVLLNLSFFSYKLIPTMPTVLIVPPFLTSNGGTKVPFDIIAIECWDLFLRVRHKVLLKRYKNGNVENFECALG